MNTENNINIKHNIFMLIQHLVNNVAYLIIRIVAHKVSHNITETEMKRQENLDCSLFCKRSIRVDYKSHPRALYLAA